MGLHFDQLHKEIASIKAHTGRDALDEYIIQEFLRFHSLGGSIIATFQQAGTNVDQRIISHVLIRSLIENFFKILYIKHDPSQSQLRFELCVNGFKQQYLKLYNDLGLDPIIQGQLQTPDPTWQSPTPGKENIGQMRKYAPTTPGKMSMRDISNQDNSN